MNVEKIKVRNTDTGQVHEVVVFSKRAEAIEVVLGEGVHNVKCTLTPTRNGLAYAGKIMGREIVYERSPEQVQADIDRLNPESAQAEMRQIKGSMLLAPLCGFCTAASVLAVCRYDLQPPAAFELPAIDLVALDDAHDGRVVPIGQLVVEMADQVGNPVSV